MESKSGSDGGRKAWKMIFGLSIIVSPSIQLQYVLAKVLDGLGQGSNDIPVSMQATIYLHNPLSPFSHGLSQFVDHKQQEI